MAAKDKGVDVGKFIRDYIDKIDPDHPPELEAVAGFVGKTNTPKHHRLYLNINLTHWLDIPKDAVVHAVEPKVPDVCFRYQVLLLLRSAQVIQVNDGVTTKVTIDKLRKARQARAAQVRQRPPVQGGGFALGAPRAYSQRDDDTMDCPSPPPLCTIPDTLHDEGCTAIFCPPEPTEIMCPITQWPECPGPTLYPCYPFHWGQWGPYQGGR